VPGPSSAGRMPQPRFLLAGRLRGVCETVCQLGAIILHISALRNDHPAHVTA
jgi:hypothetical protein